MFCYVYDPREEICEIVVELARNKETVYDIININERCMR